jgi:multiple sugar transport system ATP-binding protein
VLRIGERVVNDVHPKDRDIAMVFQNYALYPHMSVADNIGFALKLAKVPKSEIKDRVQKAAAILDLSEYLDRKPAQLSGGQRQRVAMGRAIVRQPAAFLMDEPLSNLDAKLRVQMRAEIATLQRNLGVTTVYVTHDQVEAMTMGDRVAVLRRGYLMQVDTPQHLYDHPDNVFVAGFIGSPSMNLMKAHLDGTADAATVTFGSSTLTVDPDAFSARPALKQYLGKPVVIGLRPEDLSDAATHMDHPEDQRLSAPVSLVEALGSEVIVHFKLDVQPHTTMDVEIEGVDAEAEIQESDDGKYVYVARLDPRSRARADENMVLNVDTARLHFFDPETGISIWD